MKIYTKTGDDGSTALFRGGRVLKDNLRIEAYGTVDELNAALGVANCFIIDKNIKEMILRIQNHLFIIGADLATVSENKESAVRTSSGMVNFLEQSIDTIDTTLPELKNFIIPGGTSGASHLHLARTICRRAERKVVNLVQTGDIEKNILIYLNRLSDLLFVLSRYENFVNKTPDTIWEK
ncbi:MAG: cob(I)yrinic acid a,c-diamide adenosyltransferase [Melioribacteraceae bacterium]|nr:cob(I)yrinic acid a,c-diamide adenosyltransferase [Melioribacteraceae bacterium]